MRKLVRNGSTTNGATKQTIGGRWFSIFPWVEFRQLRANADLAEARALGGMLGVLHETLAAFPEGFSGQQFNTPRAMEELERVQRTINADSTLGSTAPEFLDAVAHKIGP